MKPSQNQNKRLHIIYEWIYNFILKESFGLCGSCLHVSCCHIFIDVPYSAQINAAHKLQALSIQHRH